MQAVAATQIAGQLGTVGGGFSGLLEHGGFGCVLGRQDGVSDARVNYATGMAHVTTGGQVSRNALHESVSKIGYELVPHRDARARRQELED